MSTNLKQIFTSCSETGYFGHWIFRAEATANRTTKVQILIVELLLLALTAYASKGT